MKAILAAAVLAVCVLAASGCVAVREALPGGSTYNALQRNEGLRARGEPVDSLAGPIWADIGKAIGYGAAIYLGTRDDGGGSGAPTAPTLPQGSTFYGPINWTYQNGTGNRAETQNNAAAE